MQTQVSQLQTTGEAQEDFFGLRWFLAFVALLEGFEAFLDLPLLIDRPNLLFGPYAIVPETALGVFFAKLYVATHPLLVIAAIALAVAGSVRKLAHHVAGQRLVRDAHPLQAERDEGTGLEAAAAMGGIELEIDLAAGAGLLVTIGEALDAGFDLAAPAHAFPVAVGGKAGAAVHRHAHLVHAKGLDAAGLESAGLGGAGWPGR